MCDIHTSNLLTVTSSMYQKAMDDVNPNARNAQLASFAAMGATTNPANSTWPMSREIPASDRSWSGESRNGLAIKTSVDTDSDSSAMIATLSIEEGLELFLRLRPQRQRQYFDDPVLLRIGQTRIERERENGFGCGFCDRKTSFFIA